MMLPSTSTVSYVDQIDGSMLMLASIFLFLLLLIYIVYRYRSTKLNEIKLNAKRRQQILEDNLRIHEPFDYHIPTVIPLPTIIEETSATLSPSNSTNKLNPFANTTDIPSTPVVTDDNTNQKSLSTSIDESKTSTNSIDNKENLVKISLNQQKPLINKINNKEDVVQISSSPEEQQQKQPQQKQQPQQEQQKQQPQQKQQSQQQQQEQQKPQQQQKQQQPQQKQQEQQQQKQQEQQKPQQQQQQEQQKTQPQQKPQPQQEQQKTQPQPQQEQQKTQPQPQQEQQKTQPQPQQEQQKTQPQQQQPISSSKQQRRSRFEQDSTSSTAENPPIANLSSPPVIVRKSSTTHEHVIGDDFTSLEEINKAVKDVGLDHSQLIFGIDYTISNLETGKDSFHGYSLHHIEEGLLNPYQSVITIVGRTLEKYDSDTLIPAFGFGDRTTLDRKIFPLRPDGSYCKGFRGVLEAYNEITPKVRMSGPTNFAPLIREAIKIVKKTGEYHILVIVADGQVTNERQTGDAIVEASNYPLSIVMIGVGDGPWDMMKEFDDSLPTRQFDNFQFVNYNSVVEASTNNDSVFALRALMEIPSQYAAIKELGLLKKT
ncbi:unnamed protein product [Rotaria sp. Silwood1]|nr:unnamed protein product [Rotaria sp. Silwood1]CAF3396821.1 unnamed protein product [Rotaria sp. Silwood1]CAF4538402.1 unnamed protein product [Rotaria sp. Silwood1]CAF4552645.1 unnamed protein product [Rotaria sp. Silwood1]